MKRRTVAVTFDRDQITALDMVLAVAISQWPMHLMDVDDRLLELSAKVGQARQELDR